MTVPVAASRANPSAAQGQGPLTGLLEQPWKRYRKALKRCQRKFSPKAIHDFRVEGRRLLASLELLGGVLPARRVGKVRRLLKRHLDLFADLRDTQVQLETLAQMRRAPAAARLFRARLRKREQRFSRRTRRNITKIRTRRLSKLVAECREDMEKQLAEAAPSKALALALRSVAGAYRRTRQLRQRISAGDARTIHHTRVAFKKFRYMVEALAACLPAVTRERREAMRRYQTMMGNIQDAAVLLATLDKFLRQEEISPKAARGFRGQLVRRQERLIRLYLRSADQLLEFWPWPHSGNHFNRL